jgi:hypothetical protein
MVRRYPDYPRYSSRNQFVESYLGGVFTPLGPEGPVETSLAFNQTAYQQESELNIASDGRTVQTASAESFLTENTFARSFSIPQYQPYPMRRYPR